MRHAGLGVFFLSLTLAAAAPVPVQARDAKPDRGANAAMKYWQAFGLLPTLDKKQVEFLQRWNKVPIAGAARKLIDSSSMSRLYLHRAAQLPHCDWNLNYEDGIRLVLPHIAKARTLGFLAALHARQAFEQGRWKAGARDVADLLKMARHLKSDRTIFSHLVGYLIELTAIEAAAPYLPKLKDVLPGAVSPVLEAPGGATLAQMVRLEKQIGAQWLIRELKSAEKRKKGGWQAVWKEILDIPDEGGGGSNRAAAKAAKTFKQAIDLLEDLLPRYDELAKLAALPWKEFDAQYPKFAKKARAANALAGFVLPSMDKVAAAQRRNQAHRALFQAALAVVEGGPDKLKDIKDPFGKGPFKYRARGKGFELQSKLVFNGKAVKLTFGQGKIE
jgi:hypothetical protein